ncbi:hypothetical protein WN944_001964 [Citrus x changshan-huyou]|uniref:Uncharacterized protein n=1 Tax=Citrus x changshan-huyou TaxID=2935761 RepID=A0AAP0MKE9_9ROSI
MGESTTATVELPPIDDEGVIMLQPESIVDTCWLKRGGKLIEQSLFRWNKLPLEEYLSLRNNKLQGTIDSEALGNLTSISLFDLSLNTALEGRIPRSMASLCNLKSNQSSGCPREPRNF